MKQSKYNIFIPVKGFTIVYNSFTDKFIGISHEVVKCLNESTCLDIFCQNYRNVSDQLISLGMIVDDDFNELAILRTNHDMEVKHDKKLYVMIYPTQDCNLKCWYCYESHVAGSRMKEPVREATYNAIIKKLESREFESLLVGFFGGEPLTDFYNIAYPLSIQLKQVAEDKGIRFATFFVTNASLMDDKMINCLAEINPLFQITLDGTKEKHDKVRIWKKDNQGTYETIINAIKKISNSIKNNFSDDPVLTIRFNYDNQTLKNMDSLIADLDGTNKENVIIHFERVWQTRHLIDDEQRRLLTNAMKNFVKEGYMITHGVFRRKNVSCPADTYDFMIVNYDGKLYKCNGRTLTPESSEGELLDDGTIKWNEERLRKRFGKIAFENETCLSCKLLPLCMGPCSQKLMEEGNYCKTICSLNSIDFSFVDFLKIEFEMRYLLQKL